MMIEALISRMIAAFEGDPGVRRVAQDPALAAELLLLFRMILADGQVSGGETAALRRICRDSFGIPEESLDDVVEYLSEVGYETSGAQAVLAFQDQDIERRRQLARHMAEIAKADENLAHNEVRLLKRTLDLLGLQPQDVTSPRN